MIHSSTPMVSPLPPWPRAQNRRFQKLLRPREARQVVEIKDLTVLLVRVEEITDFIDIHMSPAAQQKLSKAKEDGWWASCQKKQDEEHVPLCS